MVFSALKLTLFVTNGPHLALSVSACDRLGQEGFESIEDFSNFKDDQLYQAIKNTRISIPSVAAVLGAQDIVVVPGVSPISPCVVSEKLALHLKVTSIDFYYYHIIGCDRNMSNMHYTQSLRTLYIEWEALIKLSKETNTNVTHLGDIPDLRSDMNIHANILAFGTN